MRHWRDRLQHRLNPLHVYCRLRDMGMGVPLARRITACYERLVYAPAFC